MQEEGDKANDEDPDGWTQLQRDEPVQAALSAKEPPALFSLLPLRQGEPQISAMRGLSSSAEQDLCHFPSGSLRSSDHASGHVPLHGP